MPSPTEISVAQLSRIIGLPGGPMLVDVRPCDDGGPGRHLLPTARQMKSQTDSSTISLRAGATDWAIRASHSGTRAFNTSRYATGPIVFALMHPDERSIALSRHLNKMSSA